MDGFWLGFVSASQIFLTLGGVYAFWRYSYRPFKVNRTDIVALNQKIADLEANFKQEMGLRRATELTDEQRVLMESRLARRGLYREA